MTEPKTLKCEAEVWPPSHRCTKTATRVLFGNEYVIGGKHQGRAVSLCGSHARAATVGRGLWMFTDPRHFYERGNLA